MEAESTSPRSKAMQACQPCRTLKVKCLPGDQSGVCLKCARSGAACVWAEYRPRVRKTKMGSKARIAALESKLDQLLGEAVSKQSPPRGSVSVSVYPSFPAWSSHTQQLLSPGTVEEVTTWGPDEVSIPGDRAPTTDFPTELLANHDMSLDEAERCLVQFREMTLYFPFVVLPADSSLSSLSQQRPMLLLAALAAASYSNKKVQISLERALRVTLLERIMLKGEKSLDLLAGLIVYLAWYQFYYVPRVETFSQLTHLAISLCTDLGLNLRPEEAVTIKYGMHLDHYTKADEQDVEHDSFFSREARRLLLGCYYLSSGASWVRGRASTIPYTPYMAECAASLRNENEYPTDSAILPLVQFQHIAEDYHEIMREARVTMHTKASIARVQAHLGVVQDQLQLTKSYMPSILRQSTFIELGFHMADIHIHEMDLINPCVDKKLAQQTEDTSTPGASLNASVRLKVIRRCLDGARDLLQSFLRIPASEYHCLSIVQWNALIFSLLVLYKLSIGLASIPEWDPEVARRSIRLEVVLETCCHRLSMATSAGGNDPASQGQDLFTLMSPICRDVRDTYLRLRQLPEEEARRRSTKVHAINFPSSPSTQNSVSADTAKMGFQHPCPAYQFWRPRRSQQSMADHSLSHNT